jgi:ApaG protein
MYSRSTNSVTITVTPEYEEEQSMPFDNQFIWEYYINIKNNRTENIQLLNRHWIIIDDRGQIQEVNGAGVVGVQPVLQPGEEFEYASSVRLNTPSGVMMGTYEMLANDEALLRVEIPTFSLDCPHIKTALN